MLYQNMWPNTLQHCQEVLNILPQCLKFLCCVTLPPDQKLIPILISNYCRACTSGLCIQQFPHPVISLAQPYSPNSHPWLSNACLTTLLFCNVSEILLTPYLPDQKAGGCRQSPPSPSIAKATKDLHPLACCGHNYKQPSSPCSQAKYCREGKGRKEKEIAN